MDNKFESDPEISESKVETPTLSEAGEEKPNPEREKLSEAAERIFKEYPNAAKLEQDKNGKSFVFVEGVDGGPAVYINETGIYRVKSAFNVIGDKRFNYSARIGMKDVAAEMLEATKKLDGKRDINGWKKVEFSELGLTDMGGRPIERAVRMNGISIKKTDLDNPIHTGNVYGILDSAEKRAIEKLS